MRVKFLGDLSVFPQHLQNLFARTEEVSADKTGMVLNIAMNYGGRAELTHAVRLLAEQVQKGTLLPEQITEDLISQHLYTAGQPDPDLVLRPSGEYRISNFLLWQSAYTEYIIMDKLWPDFTTRDLDSALREFSNRNRRFGGI